MDGPAFAFVLRFLILAASLATISERIACSGTMAPVVVGWSQMNAWVADTVSNMMGIASVRQGITITTKGFAIDVTSECSALPIYLLLASALLAFPSKGLFKAVGCLVGALCLIVINFARIISLSIVGGRHPRLFHELHVYVCPAILMAASIMFLMAWAHTGSVRVGRFSHGTDRTSGADRES